MARRLKEFQPAKREGKPKYPWKQWTDGSPWEVVHGKDYTCTSGSLVVYFYHKAPAMGMDVRTSIIRGKGKKPDRVRFQFIKRGDAEVSPEAPRKRLKRKQA